MGQEVQGREQKATADGAGSRKQSRRQAIWMGQGDSRVGNGAGVTGQEVESRATNGAQSTRQRAESRTVDGSGSIGQGAESRVVDWAGEWDPSGSREGDRANSAGSPPIGPPLCPSHSWQKVNQEEELRPSLQVPQQ